MPCSSPARKFLRGVFIRPTDPNRSGHRFGRKQKGASSDTLGMSNETPTQSGDGAIPPSLIGPALYNSLDLALCSTEEARAQVSYESALKMSALPLALVRCQATTQIHCAVSKGSPELSRALQFVSGFEPVLSEVPHGILEDAINRAYLGSDRRIERSLARLRREITDVVETRGAGLPKAQGDAAQFLSTLLEFAVARGASDLHLCPTPKGALLRLRIDGELLTQDEHLYPRSLHEQIVSRLKVLAGLDIASRLLPQDGAFTFSFGTSARCVRVSTLPVLDGESVVLRFLYARKFPQLSMLGIEPIGGAIIRRAIERAHGVILLAGPTGSGKTTTMYAVVLELQHRGRNVVAVEDPVESPIPGMVQVQVREAQGLDYPRAIRSVLRHDPDVIMIGEIRDSTSAAIALGAASSGHLTISSLHMPSALHVFERFRSFAIDAGSVANSVSVVLNQRLLPKLCERCKEIDQRGPCGITYKANGCGACGDTGFSGRVLVTELLDLQSPQVKEISARIGSVHELLERIPSAAYVPWTSALQHHLLAGHISAAQVDSFVEEEM